MKNLLTFEQFISERKEYGQKITNKEFEKIPVGSQILYVGSRYLVKNNDGFVLELEPLKGGKSIEVSYSMFNQKGAILEEEYNYQQFNRDGMMTEGTSGMQLVKIYDKATQRKIEMLKKQFPKHLFNLTPNDKFRPEDKSLRGTYTLSYSGPNDDTIYDTINDLFGS